MKTIAKFLLLFSLFFSINRLTRINGSIVGFPGVKPKWFSLIIKRKDLIVGGCISGNRKYRCVTYWNVMVRKIINYKYMNINLDYSVSIQFLFLRFKKKWIFLVWVYNDFWRSLQNLIWNKNTNYHVFELYSNKITLFLNLKNPSLSLKWRKKLFQISSIVNYDFGPMTINQIIYTMRLTECYFMPLYLKWSSR